MNIDSLLHEWVEQERIEQIGAAKERAAVVAWLRETPYWPDLETVLDDIADRIERGDHRREEGKP
jgi:hypothetical protein